MSFDPPRSAPPRVGPGVEVGIDEAVIRTQVHAFYARVRGDPMLAPVFEAKIIEWAPHLERMCDFWSSVMLMTGRYHGRPMPMHAAIPGIAPEHFQRWLDLFHETADEVCSPEAARLFVAKAELIGESRQLGIAISRGELPSRD
ncbi:MAG TPA: group III truncated hemoglobin [Caulobacteraceae bacterium]|nr:group III truncated hemoglobin [Caulobacteraceae bacterium]